MRTSLIRKVAEAGGGLTILTLDGRHVVTEIDLDLPEGLACVRSAEGQKS